jgi:allophanate hydrolase
LAVESSATQDTVRIAVVGGHLAGQPLNHQLTGRGARLCRSTRTAAGYRLYNLTGMVPQRPGLVRDEAGLGGIEVEVWELSAAGFGSFVAEIPPPLTIGTVTLADGSSVKGFLCEAFAVAAAEEITSLGGWRSWLALGARVGTVPAA